MVEFIHTLEHTLGLCGERHFSLLGAFIDFPNLSYFFNYLKVVYGRIQ